MRPHTPNSPTPPPPFSMTYTPQVAELLHQLGCTIAISTYQAGKLVFISAKDEEKLVQLPRNFNKAMGIALSGNKLALAAKHEVMVLVNSSELAWHYPKQPETYDALFVPQASYYTGLVDMHDIDFGTEGIWGVNTVFSCLCLMDTSYHFVPKWQPKFISKLAGEDRCHLNGLAMVSGKPKYVTALGTTDYAQGWRENITGGGVLIDVDSKETIAGNLAMPHSPRIFNNKLYMVLSASGEIVEVDPQTGTMNVIRKIDGFVRGLGYYKDYLFVGLSKIRQNSSTFKDLPISKKALYSGIAIIHAPTGAMVGEIKYNTSVDEIYDVQIIPGIRRPGILNTDNDMFRMALSIPGSTFWAKPGDKKA